MSTSAPPLHELDLDGQELLDDPYPIYDRLRAEDPVHWNQRMGVWFLTRYADVAAALKDPALSSERIPNFIRMLPPDVQQVVQPLERHLVTYMLFRDPPYHTRLRAITSKAFSPRVIRDLSERIDSIVDELMAPLASRGAMDVIGDFSFHLPMILVAEALGVRPADRLQFRHWLETIELFATVGRAVPENALKANDSVLALSAYLHDVVDARRRHPSDDLLSVLTSATDDAGRTFTDEEVIGTAAFLLLAAHETTMNLIGSGLHALLTNPGELARLRADESLLDTAIEEMVRYEGPAHRSARFAIAETTIGGTRILPGQRVVVGLGSANRDPAQFAEPNRFDVGRRDNRHVGFGHGVHYCIGALLARMETKAAFRALLRLPELHLAPGPLVRRKTFSVRAIERLPVRWAVRPTA